jgi:single stranded DNA-binding protein
MNGLHCAFTGRVGTDPTRRFTMSGKQLLEFRVAVDENQHQTESRPDPPETQWIKVVVWEEAAERLEQEGRLRKGAAAYCEGRLRLERWTKADGTPMAGLSLSAWTVQPMGQLGERRRPPLADRVPEGAAF